MRDPICSNIERNVVLKGICDHKRLDCRTIDETRPLKIEFRSHPGHVSVTLGSTHVLAQASCRIIKPKGSRGIEGLIRIHLDMSQIPYISLDNWKHHEYGQQLNNILERNICQSDCVDLESLCIQAREYVWSIKIDLTVLNNGGNILDCANLAALCSLSHFRLPEVSVHGVDVHVFSAKERHMRPLSILRYPINVFFAFFVDGRYTLIDPNADEERLMDGFLAISMNEHKEICGIQMGGALGLKREQIDLCKKVAFKRVLELTDLVRQEVSNYYKYSDVLLGDLQAARMKLRYFRALKPTMTSQPSVVRTAEDDDDGSRESENNRSTPIHTIEKDISLVSMPNINGLSIRENDSSNDNRRAVASDVHQ